MTRALIAVLIGAATSVSGDPDGVVQRAGEGAMSLRGVDLYMHNDAPTFGELREPTIWVHAESGSLSPATDIWSLSHAAAVIYREAEADLHVRAESGRFDQANQRAYLERGVEARAGRMVVRLEALEWDNEQRVARSTSMARLEHGVNELAGASMWLFPGEDRVELGRGFGKIQLAQGPGGAAPGSAGDGERADRYETIELQWQGKLVGNLNGNLQRITEGAHLIVLGASEADNLDIKAESVAFEYDSPDATMPARMKLTDDVVFRHSGGTIRAEDVVLDFTTDRAVFRGEPRVDSDTIKGLKAEYIELDLDTGEFVMGPGTIEEVQLNREEAGAAGDARP